MKRVGNLWVTLISEDNLRGAIDEVNRTHHWHNHHVPNQTTAWVEEHKERCVFALKECLVQGFEPKPGKERRRYDQSAQKWRVTYEPAQWPDQYVHHALIRVIEPVLMRGMDPYCCGSIKGRGARFGQKSIERWVRKDRKGTRYCMQLDIRHFYDNIRPEFVMARMRERIKDAKVLDLTYRIIKDGVKIGGYTSQWMANTLLQPLDKIIRESGVSHYLRYIDNFTLFTSSKRKARRTKTKVEKWLFEHGLELKGDWQIFKTDDREPVALGFRYGRAYTVPRKRNFLRLKRAVSKYRKRKAKGRRVFSGVAAGLISRIGQIKNCSNVHLYRMVLRGERIQRELKAIARAAQKNLLTWPEYMAARAA